MVKGYYCKLNRFTIYIGCNTVNPKFNVEINGSIAALEASLAELCEQRSCFIVFRFFRFIINLLIYCIIHILLIIMTSLEVYALNLSYAYDLES